MSLVSDFLYILFHLFSLHFPFHYVKFLATFTHYTMSFIFASAIIRIICIFGPTLDWCGLADTIRYNLTRSEYVAMPLKLQTVRAAPIFAVIGIIRIRYSQLPTAANNIRYFISKILRSANNIH
ncbi:hypothetical protein V1515DRAFT_591060 [Lipomyces mesembrius]